MSNLTKIEPLIDFTQKGKILKPKKENEELTLEQALDLGILVSGLEVMSRATVINSCYLEPWQREVGNIKDNDVMYANSIVALEYPELSKYVTNTVGLFAGCENNHIDISNFDFRNVWNTDSMFKDCHNVTKINLGNNTFPKNIDAAHMFENCYNVRKIEGIENMSASKLLSLNSCWKNCENLARLDLKDWYTPFLEDIENCWNNCRILSYLAVDNFDTSICKKTDNFMKDTLSQISDVRRHLMKMAFIGKETLEDMEYDENDKKLESRLEKINNIKMEKYEENPVLLALALKVIKSVDNINFNEQEEFLKSLYLSPEDLAIVKESFLKEEYEEIDVENQNIMSLVEDIEELREDCFVI